MPFPQCKVSHDGSHYIAIPHTEKPYKPRPKKVEERIEVVEENTPIIAEENAVNADLGVPNEVKTETITQEETSVNADMGTPKIRSMTRKELFEELYQKNIAKKPNVRKRIIVESMLPYFKTKTQAVNYVAAQFERRERNLICRRMRLKRKVYLQEWSYFCTFTYSDKLHTEESFKHKLRGCLKMMCHRHGWKYAGVWERGKKDRLHFHGLFYIPEGQMVGELFPVKDYNTNTHQMQITNQNTYFNKRFGRSDFDPIDSKEALGDSIAYLLKYVHKQEGKIVYSKGLPQFFISDIMDDDVACRTGIEDRKLVLFDDFLCIDDGEVIGKVSAETIAKMRKCN